MTRAEPPRSRRHACLRCRIQEAGSSSCAEAAATSFGAGGTVGSYLLAQEARSDRTHRSGRRARADKTAWTGRSRSGAPVLGDGHPGGGRRAAATADGGAATAGSRRGLGEVPLAGRHRRPEIRGARGAATTVDPRCPAAASLDGARRPATASAARQRQVREQDGPAASAPLRRRAPQSRGNGAATVRGHGRQGRDGPLLPTSCRQTASRGRGGRSFHGPIAREAPRVPLPSDGPRVPPPPAES